MIETRATFLRTYDGRRVVIPNSTLFTESVIVNTAYEMRRLQYDIGIGYGDDIETARQLILDCLRQAPTAIDNPAPECIVIDALADSTVNLRARWWINPPRKADTFRSLDEVLTAVKNTLSANGIDLPYPTQQILLHDQTESTDGNRATQREGWPATHGVPTSPRPIGGIRSASDEQDPTGHGTAPTHSFGQAHRADYRPSSARYSVLTSPTLDPSCSFATLY